jgi:hypothetical protein
MKLASKAGRPRLNGVSVEIKFDWPSNWKLNGIAFCRERWLARVNRGRLSSSAGGALRINEAYRPLISGIVMSPLIVEMAKKRCVAAVMAYLSSRSNGVSGTNAFAPTSLYL